MWIVRCEGEKIIYCSAYIGLTEPRRRGLPVAHRAQIRVVPMPRNLYRARLSDSSGVAFLADVSAGAARRYCAGQEILWPSSLAVRKGQ